MECVKQGKLTPPGTPTLVYTNLHTQPHRIKAQAFQKGARSSTYHITLSAFPPCP